MMIFAMVLTLGTWVLNGAAAYAICKHWWTKDCGFTWTGMETLLGLTTAMLGPVGLIVAMINLRRGE